MNIFNKLVLFIKDLQVLLAFLGLSSVVVLNNIDKSLDVVQKYNLHILFFYLIGLVLIYKLLQKQIKEMNHRLDTHLIKASEDRLRANVKQLAKDLADVKVIDKEHTIRYIYDLEERRKELKLNSYTQAALKDMMSRIKQ